MKNQIWRQKVRGDLKNTVKLTLKLTKKSGRDSTPNKSEDILALCRRWDRNLILARAKLILPKRNLWSSINLKEVRGVAILFKAISKL